MAANTTNVHVLSHPLVNTRLAKLRQVSTTSKEFREVKSITSYSGQPHLSTVLQGIHELSIMVGYEASRDLEETSVQGVRIGITGINLSCLRHLSL